VSERKIVARNRRAFRNFEILERFEAGVALLGPEVKSLRSGKVSIAEAYAAFKGSELYLLDMHIPEYSHTGYAPHEPLRPRKLLLHGRELKKLEAAVTRRGLTLVPLQVYFQRGRVKVEIALARGKRYHDKREALRKEEAQREARRAEGRRKG
jgi:SsrA-binding protein